MLYACAWQQGQKCTGGAVDLKETAPSPSPPEAQHHTQSSCNLFTRWPITVCQLSCAASLKSTLAIRDEDQHACVRCDAPTFAPQCNHPTPCLFCTGVLLRNQLLGVSHQDAGGHGVGLRPGEVQRLYWWANRGCRIIMSCQCRSDSLLALQ